MTVRTEPYRVVVWGPGYTGSQALREIARRPELRLVGCLAYSPAKVGRDAMELIGDGGSSGRSHIVVTGGAGFIGNTLVDRLLAEGWAVTAVDSFEHFYPTSITEDRLAKARSGPPSSWSELTPGTEPHCSLRSTAHGHRWWSTLLRELEWRGLVCGCATEHVLSRDATNVLLTAPFSRRRFRPVAIRERNS